jgi:V8-like Glu-specific endopeptidase
LANRGNTNMKSVFFILAAAFLNQASSQALAQTHVIYGDDNRQDLYAITNPMYITDSTVALMQSSDLSQNSSGKIDITAQTFQQLMQVCTTERFYDQPSGAFCSGALIGKNLILTAGHCITDADSCASTKFVFGYHVLKQGVYPSDAPESEVYGCKSIIHREQNDSGADFGIIETDRDVTGHTPLALNQDRLTTTIDKGAKLLMIGHPSGLPTKLDDGGLVRDPSQSGFFVATTDSYGGNSGSPIFNQDKGTIEGVLVRGENDFNYDEAKGCNVSNVCPEDGCRGEDVTKVASIIPFVPKN